MIAVLMVDVKINNLFLQSDLDVMTSSTRNKAYYLSVPARK